MEITLENADIYFSGDNHTMSAVWSAYTETQRKAALATARRNIERSLHRTLKDSQTDGDDIRDDFAVFEQALFELRKRPMSNANEGQPYPVAQDAVLAQGAEAVRSRFPQWSDEALRWLGWNGVAVIRS